MHEKKNYIIVKDRHPRISEVLNDCVKLCVPASRDESLASILQKICAKITNNFIQLSNQIGDIPVYSIEEGDNITITGTGTESDPWVISSTGGGGGDQTFQETLLVTDGSLLTTSNVIDVDSNDFSIINGNTLLFETSDSTNPSLAKLELESANIFRLTSEFGTNSVLAYSDTVDTAPSFYYSASDGTDESIVRNSVDEWKYSYGLVGSAVDLVIFNGDDRTIELGDPNNIFNGTVLEVDDVNEIIGFTANDYQFNGLINNTAQTAIVGTQPDGKIGYLNIDPSLTLSAGVLSVTTPSSTPTLQQVLTAGATLTGNNTIVNGANTLTISNDGIGANTGLGLFSTSGQTQGRLLYAASTSSGLTNNAELVATFFGGSGTGTTRAASFRNANSGTTVNIGATFAASGAVDNYAAKFDVGRVSFGFAGSQTATLEFFGSTSGVITLKTANTAGTYTLTLPTTDGNANEFLQTDGSGILTWAAAGGVTSVAGTTDRITSSGGATPIIDIAATYLGQASITTLGTITTGTLSTGAVIGGVTMTLGSDAANDIYYRNGSGVLTRLANGTTGQVLTATTASAPSWAAASGNVTKVGTPVDNQIGIWTGDGTIEGSTQLTFTGQALQLASTNTVETTVNSVFATTTNSLTTGTSHYIASSSLSSGRLMHLVVTGTAGLTNQTGLLISLSGANATGAQTTYGLDVSNTHTGTSTNVAARFTASGGSNNTAAIFSGRVAMGGVTSPFSDLDVGAGTIAAGSITITSAAGTAAAGNFSTSGTTIIGTNAGSIYQYDGSTNSDGRVYVGGTGATQIGAGRPYATFIVGAATVPEAASGNHPFIGSAVFIPPAITTGAATVTDAATVRITGPTTVTVSGTNSALLINSGNLRMDNGNISLNTAGNKLNIATGSNASVGVSGAMTAGTITISTTAVTASSRIFLTHATLGGTQGILSVGTIVAATSFVINSSSATDTGTVNWWIIN